MNEQSTPLDEISEAARRIRTLAEAANTDEARRPYSDDRIDPVPEAQWGKLVNNYLGGELGAHCASWTPTIALDIAEMLERFVAVFRVGHEPGECPNCGTYCAGHRVIYYHEDCDMELHHCACLKPYLQLAQIYLGAAQAKAAR